MNTYFFSFIINGIGFGNVTIRLPYSIEDELKKGKPVISEIQKKIEKKYKIKGAVILYFKRL